MASRGSKQSAGKGSRGRSYTTERLTFLIILEDLLTTWNSDYFVSFWQYHYGLTRTLTSVTTHTDLSRTDGRTDGHEYSRYFIPFKTLMSKGITNYMYDRGSFLNFYSSWIIHCFSLAKVNEKSRNRFFLITKSYPSRLVHLCVNAYKW